MSNVNTQVTTGVCRLSYLYVFEPKEDQSGKLKRSVQLLIPKTDTKTLNDLKAAVNACIASKWGNNAPSNLRHPLRDGDIGGAAGIGDMNVEPGDDPYGGHFFMNASNTKKVTILDKNGRPMLDPEGIKSGDYAHVSVSFYPYDNKRNGVGCSLRGIMFHEKGEPLASDFDATDDFAHVQAGSADAGDMDFLG